jgi:opacity protein-like surface antigen
MKRTILLAALLLAPLAAVKAADVPKPNIIVIVADVPVAAIQKRLDATGQLYRLKDQPK